jgi:cell division protein FtsB
MVQNALRKEVNRLNEENDKLAEEVKALEGQVGRLHEEESKLDSITKQQGIDSQTFMHLIEENSTTIDELKVLNILYVAVLELSLRLLLTT